MSVKTFGKLLLCRLLEAQVRQLRRKNNFRVIAVVGSVGKTSTKLAIAKTLEGDLRVRYQEGNYNDRLTVPLALFDQSEPGIFSVFGWLKTLIQNQRRLHKPYAYDVAVLEFGIDAPGQMRSFAYLNPDLVVVTGISAEHLAYFKTLDVVAAEELLALSFSKQALLNLDDIPPEYLPTTPYLSYGVQLADYTIAGRTGRGLEGQELRLEHEGKPLVTVRSQLLGEPGAKTVLAAAAVADILGLPVATISKKLARLAAAPGRMQLLPGIQHSTLIDDTYNASPVAVKAALDVLYAAEASQRIAILGSMNEMGADSPALHRTTGSYCDPSKLDMVLVIGVEAGQYLAPAAQKNGCQVQTFNHPLAAGQYARDHLRPGAVVLAKGSQNGVFAEEALVPLLANPQDDTKLVRQSPYWKAKKTRSLPILSSAS